MNLSPFWTRTIGITTITSGCWSSFGSGTAAGLRVIRTFHDLEGIPLALEETLENELRHTDTSCFLIHRSGYACLTDWLTMPKVFSPASDRLFRSGLFHRKFQSFQQSGTDSRFRSQYHDHYNVVSRPSPVGAKVGETLAEIFDFLSSTEGRSLCMETLGYYPPKYFSAKPRVVDGLDRDPSARELGLWRASC